MSAAGASDRPIFVGGCPRSGTTLMQVMLHAHPRIAIPPENAFLYEAYRARRTFGDLRDPLNRARVAEYIAAQPKYADLQISPEVLREKIVAGPPTIGSAIGIALREYANRFDKPRWGDKRPSYSMEYELMLTLFPDAQIVHLVRDGRACVASLKRMRFWKSGAIDAMAKWVEATRVGLIARRALPADRYHEIQYEELVANPQPVVERLCAFLGEEFSELMLRPEQLAPSVIPDRKTWHSRTREPISAAAVSTWQTELAPTEIGLFEQVAAKEMAAYGYEASGLGVPPALRDRLQFEYLLRRRDVRRVGRHLVYRHIARQDPVGVAARLTSGQRAG